MTPYQLVANAIVAQAAEDYQKALTKLKRKPDDIDAQIRKYEVERFCQSEWYKVLTSADSTYILGEIRRKVALS